MGECGGRGGKHQIPSSKLQRNPKFQVPITVLPALEVARAAGLESSESAGVRASNIQHPTSDIEQPIKSYRLSPTANIQQSNHPTIQSSDDPQPGTWNLEHRTL